jgi:hypothetical protein
MYAAQIPDEVAVIEVGLEADLEVFRGKTFVFDRQGHLLLALNGLDDLWLLR